MGGKPRAAYHGLDHDREVVGCTVEKSDETPSRIKVPHTLPMGKIVDTRLYKLGSVGCVRGVGGEGGES